MDEEKFKAFHKKHNIPENCPNIIVPKCNAKIWKNNLTSPYRMNEIKKNKLPAPTEKLILKEKGSEVEQQQILQELENVSKPKLNKFVAANLRIFYLNRKSITNDEIILDIMKNGLKTDFKERPRYICVPKIQHSTKEKKIRDTLTLSLQFS